MKRFFGGAFIEREKLKEIGIDYPIKLEYYKKINEDENNKIKNKYGISIVKTEYIPDNFRIETKDIEEITNDEREVNKILDIFKTNQVTTINSEEVISDFYKSKF